MMRSLPIFDVRLAETDLEFTSAGTVECSSIDISNSNDHNSNKEPG